MVFERQRRLHPPRCARLAALALLMQLASFAHALPPERPRTLKLELSHMRGSNAVELKQGRLSCHRFEYGRVVTQMTYKPSAMAWREFRATLDQMPIWRWQGRYIHRSIEDGLSWRVDIRYADGAVKSVGSNAFPDAGGGQFSAHGMSPAFKQLLAAVSTLAPGCQLQADTTRVPKDLDVPRMQRPSPTAAP